MVSHEFILFQTYRQQAEALKDSAQSSLDLLNQIGDLSGTQKYLAKRAGISKHIQDELMKGGKQTKAKLKELIKELEEEMKEIDQMLSRISILSIDAFHAFQRSALSHQKRQSEILTSVMNKEISYLNALEHHIHSRTNSLEQSHNRFREKLYEVLIAIINKQDRATIANTFADCVAFLLLYTRDDQELALPRHTYVQLVEQEQYGPARVILSNYFTSNYGEHVNIKLEKAGLKRRARDEYSNKEFYENLSKEQQHNIDSIVKQSLKTLLTGAELQHPQNGRIYSWENIKAAIDEIYKGESKINSEITKNLNSIIDAFEKATISKFGAPLVSSGGFDNFKILEDITIAHLKGKDKFLEKDENLNKIKEAMRIMEIATKEEKVLKQLVEQNSNIFYVKSGENSSEESWFSGVEALSNYTEFHSVVQEMLTLCQGLKEDSLYSEERVSQDSVQAVETKLNGLKEGSKRLAKSLSTKEYFNSLNKQEMISQLKNVNNSLNSLTIHSSKTAIINIIHQIEGVLRQLS